ncbi:MAG: DOMON-like domain-containing protein [Oculatellaceae cyanobacterium Prado106]|nr:DOMON-like domain-containing protein [Oculatellaceae cyanobacterium Prado106]
MSYQSFSLVPFASHSETFPFTISGDVSWEWKDGVNRLALNYDLSGDLTSVMIPPAAAYPGRRDGLWETTCFECFLGIPGMESYWEFNLSPAGDWNVYRFTGYRQGREDEGAFVEVPFAIAPTSQSLSLHLDLDLTALVSHPASLEMAVTAVIEQRDKGGDRALSYWALAHKGDEADFHLRGSFGLLL